jgi:hypothetical protein
MRNCTLHFTIKSWKTAKNTKKCISLTFITWDLCVCVQKVENGMDDIPLDDLEDV